MLVDPHTLWMFDGEEFLRASHLWTYGYDLYSPSKLGSVVYHNYTAVPNHYQHEKVDKKVKEEEREFGNNRFKMIYGIPFKGKVNAMELDKYGFGTARTLAEYFKFSGVSFAPNTSDNDTCHQLYWVPYSDPSSVEVLLPGWEMNPKTGNFRDEIVDKVENDIDDDAADSPNIALETANSPKFLSLVTVILVIGMFIMKKKSHTPHKSIVDKE